MADRLLKRAQSDLSIPVPGVRPDLIVWEHSSRVVRSADAIASLPEVGSKPVDRRALGVAALYHDMGWALQVREGVLTPGEVFLRPTCDLMRELAADWIVNRLDKAGGS